MSVNCRRSPKKFLFLYLVLIAKNFSRHAGNLRLMETNAYYTNSYEAPIISYFSCFCKRKLIKIRIKTVAKNYLVVSYFDGAVLSAFVQSVANCWLPPWISSYLTKNFSTAFTVLLLTAQHERAMWRRSQ